MLKLPQSSYLNGIIKLHGAFEKAARQALNISLKYIPQDDAYIKRMSYNSQYLNGRLLVDFSQEQPQNALKGYFIFGGKHGVVHRFLSIIIEYPFFFPVFDYGKNVELCKGIKYSDIEKMIIAKKPVIFLYRPINVLSDKKLVFFRMIAYSNIENNVIAPKDDVGMPFCTFTDIPKLGLEDIPETLLAQEYTAVGINHYVPYSTEEESYCVLFAQLDNPYDNHAIKLLRWFPQNRNFNTYQDKCFWGDVFYEMGYVSRNENMELYQFMTSNKSRILFGKKTGNKVILLGGVKMFQNLDFRFPKCLSNITIE